MKLYAMRFESRRSLSVFFVLFCKIDPETRSSIEQEETEPQNKTLLNRSGMEARRQRSLDG
jgi:hypothetical protein